MGYKVIMSPEAAKAFKKLDKPIQQRIAALVENIEASSIRDSEGKLSREMTRNGGTASEITDSFAKSRIGN